MDSRIDDFLPHMSKKLDISGILSLDIFASTEE